MTNNKRYYKYNMLPEYCLIFIIVHFIKNLWNSELVRISIQPSRFDNRVLFSIKQAVLGIDN